MFRCPKCKKVSPTITYRGPVLIVEGTAEVNANGRIVSLGPARAIRTVELGKELDDNMELICRACKFEGAITLFNIVRSCIISGQEATMEFATPFGLPVWIAENQVDNARRIFSPERAAWETPMPEDIFNV